MKIRKFDIWLANLNSSKGQEPGKTRAVVIIQTDFLNNINYKSTIICPITSKIIPEVGIMRIAVAADDMNGLKKDSSILVDQIRSIDNVRLIYKIGQISPSIQGQLMENIKIILD